MARSLAAHQHQLLQDFERFKSGLPQPLEQYVLETYGISLESIYGKHIIKNPFGKASGQLSLSKTQVKTDVESGLGFVVLKTLIAQDEHGEQSMSAWATLDTHMKLEEIHGTRPEVQGTRGWTVTWKGRGWGHSFGDYLDLLNVSLRTAGDTLIVPSVKYHLLQPGESAWRTSEYEFTTQALQSVWHRYRATPMPLEKDFSPTLAGDQDYSRQRSTIVHWLDTVPGLIREAAREPGVSLGIKVFNAQFEDSFQEEMLGVLCAPSQTRADVLIYANRLFDPQRSFEGKQGVAYGGPDLSARNIAVLQATNLQGTQVSATGNVLSGRTAYQYLCCGATSFQMHTVFQLPDSAYDMSQGSRTARALHRLLFHPAEGLLFLLVADKHRFGWPDGITIAAIAHELSSLPK
jgi:hypothetical protein